MKIKPILVGALVLCLSVVLYLNTKSIAFDTANILVNGSNTYQSVELAEEFGTTLRSTDGGYYAEKYAPKQFKIATATHDPQQISFETEYLVAVIDGKDSAYDQLRNS